LSHNTVRGAAGATILNAELLASLGKLEPAAFQSRGNPVGRFA
jgi:aspartate-semialdehyde dehydrogenase